MEINRDAQIDTDQVRDVGRSGGGGFGGMGGLPIPIPSGWVGLVILGLLVVGGLLGGNALLGGAAPDSGSETPVECPVGDPNRVNDLKCRNALYVNSIQDYWTDAAPQHFNTPYEASDTVFFEQAVNTGCGAADSGVGPFYCPEDNLIYIDLSFWNQLATDLGATGAFAQPYVLAHEYGHHMQDILGTEAKVSAARQANPEAANELSVMLELQADCYAGAWARNAALTTDEAGRPLFTSITEQDINEALEAAAAVGDDAIQKKMGGRVDESQFTHGSSAQRQQWFKQGYNTGDPKTCDTFEGAI
jgi:hypothetical protein